MLHRRFSTLLSRLLLGGSAVWACLLAMPAAAGTLVEVRTSLGNFYLEMNDAQAPNTVANFLNYVNSGRYNSTFIHGAVGGTYIRGGGYVFNGCSSGIAPIPTDAPIPAEATGLSNLDGTIATLRPSANPDGASSQWFINLGDDPSLDTRDGGYVVFGKVLGAGRSVVHDISNARPLQLGFFNETPTLNYFEEQYDCAKLSRDNLVQIIMSVVTEDQDQATANYDTASNTLDMNLDLGDQGFFNLSFAVTTEGAQATLLALESTITPLDMPVPNMATYNGLQGRLTLPSIAVDGEILFRNIAFQVSEENVTKFVLTSFE